MVMFLNSVNMRQPVRTPIKNRPSRLWGFLKPSNPSIEAEKIHIECRGERTLKMEAADFYEILVPNYTAPHPRRQ